MPSMSGSTQIEQHDVRPPRAEDFNRARPMTRRGAHLVARRARRLLDDHLQPVGHHRLVVDDEHTLPLVSASVLEIHVPSAYEAGNQGGRLRAVALCLIPIHSVDQPSASGSLKLAVEPPICTK